MKRSFLTVFLVACAFAAGCIVGNANKADRAEPRVASQVEHKPPSSAKPRVASQVEHRSPSSANALELMDLGNGVGVSWQAIDDYAVKHRITRAEAIAQIKKNSEATDVPRGRPFLR